MQKKKRKYDFIMRKKLMETCLKLTKMLKLAMTLKQQF